MNGARSTLMRKGYWLTALAAAVLLAASSGTALAQNTTGVTIEGPSNDTVNEGGTATYTVAVKGYAKAESNVGTVTVKLSTPTPDGKVVATEGEESDLHQNEGDTVKFTVPANSGDTAKMFSGSKTLRVGTNQDPDAEDEKFTLKFDELTDTGGLTEDAEGKKKLALAKTGNPTSLTIKDDETQTYVLALDPASQKPTEGLPVTVSLTAVPAHVDGEKDLTLNIDQSGSGWSVSPTTKTIKEKKETITIANPAEDKNRVPDTVTLTAHSGRAGDSKLEDSLTITLADKNALPTVQARVVDKAGKALNPQPTSVEEGKSVKIAVMPLDKDGKVTRAKEDLEITLAPTGSADARDYRALAKITITLGENASDAVDLVVETDEDVGTETLMFDATVSGEAANGPGTNTSAGVLSLTIEDATATKIAPKAEADAYPKITGAIKAGSGDDEVLNPGETVKIMTSDLFTLAAGYTASYGASVEGGSVSASTSGEMVTVNALKAGESKVTITGTAKAGASSFTPDQTVSNVARITFDVTVVDKALVVTLEMPANVMNGNIVEGKSYDIMVSANRAITEAEGSVDVMIMRDRAKSDADDDDFTVSSATIMAGKDSATAELMVTEDMMPDGGTDDNMGEQLVLYGMAGDMETNSLTFTIWDQAVPTLPLIGQLLLALFLMLGGARLYRRRQG